MGEGNVKEVREDIREEVEEAQAAAAATETDDVAANKIKQI